MERIQIQQTPAALHITSRAAQFRVNRSQKTVLNMRQSPAQMNMETQPPRLLIDQTECFASAGLKTPLRIAEEFCRRSLAEGLEAISSIVEEGLRFLRIEEGGQPFRDIAATRGVYTKQLSVRAMPSERPKITIEPGSVRVNWTPHSTELSWEVVEADMEFVPHEIDIGVESYPSIEIRVVNDGRTSPLDERNLSDPP